MRQFAANPSETVVLHAHLVTSSGPSAPNKPREGRFLQGAASRAAALIGLTLLATVSRAYTVKGGITCDNETMMFTAKSEGHGLELHSVGVHACWPGAQVVNVTSGDRFLYLACWSDNNAAQGLLLDFTINSSFGTLQAFSGSQLWKVAPGDSDIAGCSSPTEASIAAAMASRIPTMSFVDVAVGCNNPPIGVNCYDRWGHVAEISASARWMWFNSGLQASVNAPFEPGFNHREFLIFRLDLLTMLPVPTRTGSWGRLKAMYR
jgi:hypothetical protein